jgi:hypothetical protein
MNHYKPKKATAHTCTPRIARKIIIPKIANASY